MRTEGQVSILQSGNDVFFNPAQVINRDMSMSGAAAAPVNGPVCSSRFCQLKCQQAAGEQQLLGREQTRIGGAVPDA